MVFQVTASEKAKEMASPEQNAKLVYEEGKCWSGRVQNGDILFLSDCVRP